MIHPGFISASERLVLEPCVRRQREDHGIARQATAMLLLDDGKCCQEISDFLYLDDDTIRGWYKSYRQNGWETLAFDGWKGGQSHMTQALPCVRGWKSASVAQRPRSVPISVLNLVWIAPIPAASSFCPGLALNTAKPNPFRAWHQRKSRPLSSHHMRS
jgi:hypothetical protein